MQREDIFALISEERKRQDELWGGYDHDREHSPAEWASYILQHVAEYSHWEASVDQRSDAMLKAAALCVCALELIDNQDTAA